MEKAKVALARKLGVILHRMWVDENAVLPGRQGGFSRACNRLKGEAKTTVFGRVETPGLPEAKSPRRDDGRGQTAEMLRGDNDHAQLDWPASSSSNPIRWRPRADHGQKSEPAKG